MDAIRSGPWQEVIDVDAGDAWDAFCLECIAVGARELNAFLDLGGVPRDEVAVARTANR
jgi:hypothetical protein